MRKTVLLLIVICVSQLAFSQKNNEETEMPKLQLENRKWVMNSITILETQHLTIKLKGQDHLVKGQYTSFTDSTLVVDATTIAFNEIESIRVTKHGGLGLGVGMLVTGVTMSGLGIMGISKMDEYYGLAEGLLVLVLGGGAVIVGTVMSTISAMIIPSSTHTYKTKKWKLYVSYPDRIDKKIERINF